MNIILVTDNPQEGDVLKEELNKQASAIRIVATLNSQSAFTYLNASSACDAILLGASVSTEDAVNLVSAIRLTKKSMGIVTLVETDEENPPTELIRAGVDRVIMKGSGFISLLEEAFLKAMQRRQSESASNGRQVRIIYAGNAQDIQPHLSGFPHWMLEQAAFEPDGLLRLPEIASSQDAVIVIDYEAPGERALEAIGDIKLRTPDIPIILITPPEDEEVPIRAMNAGASDCVAKKENYIKRLLPAVEREVKRRQIIRNKEALQRREESLRQVIETMPVGIAVIAPDGTFLAINHTGLGLLGAERLDQIIGKSIVRMLPSEERDKIISLLATISQGTGTSIKLNWRGLDGTISGTELRAVPMRRGPSGTLVALAVIAPPTDSQKDEKYLEEAQKEIEELKKSLQESEARYGELQNQEAVKTSTWEEELEKARSGQSAAEEQLAILKKTAEEAETRHMNLLEEQRAERANWEQARESYKEQCAKIEGSAQALKAAQETLVETHDRERAEWESRLQELEQKKNYVEEQLTRISDESDRERSRWESARQELEQKLQSAEERCSEQETALEETQSKLVRLEETLGKERSQWDLVRQELEQRLQETEKRHSAELRRILSDAESRIAAVLEENRSQSTQLEEVRREIEQLKAKREKLAAEFAKTHLRYQRLSQAITEGFVLAARDGQVLECNDAAARMFGYAGAEDAAAAVDEGEFRIYAFEGDLAARLQKEKRLDNVEWSSLTRDGRLIRIQENARLAETSAEEPSLVERVLTDITRIHRLGEEIRQARRLESNGDLAAATVRSLNGICISLENSGKLLIDTPDEADAVQQAAETLLKDVRRGIKHSRQYLSIAGKRHRIPDLGNLNEILSNNDHLLRSLTGEDIDLQMLLSPRGGLVTADHQELIQLIAGLVAGSREALPLGGTVIIETSNADIDISTTGYPGGMRSGIYVQMTISADACVVHPERRIASNRMIVERLGGWMQTTNNADCGNLHQIYLPRVEPFGGQAGS